MRRVLSLALLLAALPSLAQWQIVTPAPTTADLRGIDNVGNGIAWASGSNGTVLRTQDAGKSWTRCATPPDADRLDFRAVQAFDADTAIVMSIGKGPLSRLYKTTDGCHTWKLLMTNLDKDGFFDALVIPKDKAPQYEKYAMLLGNPVKSHMVVLIVSRDSGAPRVWYPPTVSSPKTIENETAFAASNSALFVFSSPFAFCFGTGGPAGTRATNLLHSGDDASYGYRAVPIGDHSASSGIFSIVFRVTPRNPPAHRGLNKPWTPPTQGRAQLDRHGVAVGGDYVKPDTASAIAAFSTDYGKHWLASLTQPHGFRSAVAYDEKSNTWITVGPNGTDISIDDGRNWRALLPDPSAGDAPDADQHWNALSLPYVVGPHGRIGILRPSAISSPHHP